MKLSVFKSQQSNLALLFKHLTAIVGLLCLVGCSAYKTNSELSFLKRYPSQEPDIHIGKVDVGNEELDYLCWIDAKVSKPHMLATAPTEAQVNLVLAELAKPLQADAVTFVTYKRGLAGQTIEARGQAVRFKNPVTQRKYSKTSGQAQIVSSPRNSSTMMPYTKPATAVIQPSYQPPREPKLATPIVSAAATSPIMPGTLKFLDDDALALIISNAIYVIEQSKALNRKDLQLSAQTIKALAEQAKTVE